MSLWAGREARVALTRHTKNNNANGAGRRPRRRRGAAHRVAARACDPKRYEPSIASALLAAPRNGSAAAEAFMSGCSGETRLWTAYDTKKYVQNNWHAGKPTGASCGHLQRIGLYGDGGKMLCDTAQLLPDKQPCRVISVGSNGEFSFERGIRDLASHCSIDVFDGTLINERAALAAKLPSYVKFVAKNVDASTWRQYQGDTSIRILKMDCEGCELRALLPFVENVCVEQLLLETHLCLRSSDVDRNQSRKDQVRQLHGLFLGLDVFYEIFHVEPNLAYGDGTCVEYAFVRRLSCRA